MNTSALQKRSRTASGPIAAVLLIVLVAALATLPRLSDAKEPGPAASAHDPEDGGAWLYARHRSAVPEPAPEETIADGMLPRYLNERLDLNELVAVASTAFDIDFGRTRSVEFMPTSSVFQVGTSCENELPADYMISYEINGKPFGRTSCGAGLMVRDAKDAPGTWEEGLELRAGEPLTVTTRIVYAPVVEPGSTTSYAEDLATYTGPLPHNRVGVAVYAPFPTIESELVEGVN